MITLGIKTPLSQSCERGHMYKISNVANSILTCNSDLLANLFILDSKPEL